MKYCEFKEVDKIKQMCTTNPYLYGVIDPCCAFSVNESTFNPRELYYVEHLAPIKPNSEQEMKKFFNNISSTELNELQPTLKNHGFSSVLPRQNFNYPIPKTINDQGNYYLNPHYDALRSGVLINVKKVKNELDDSSTTNAQKAFIVKYYNTLLEYSYVSWIYSFMCQRLQQYISIIEKNDGTQHTRDYDTLFGFIYQNYVEPALLQLQNYFINFKINDEIVKKDLHLFDFQKDKDTYGDQYHTTLKEMTFEDFHYTMYCIARTTSTRVDDDCVCKSHTKQNAEDKINSVLHLLVAYNSKLQNIFGPKYAFEQKPYASYQELVDTYNKIYEELNDCDTLYS